jgi:hypothetical protein
MNKLIIHRVKKEAQRVEIPLPTFRKNPTGNDLFAAWSNDKTIHIACEGRQMVILVNSTPNTIENSNSGMVETYEPITEQEFFDEYRKLLEVMPFDRTKEISPALKSSPTFFRNNEINNQTTHY